MQIVGVLQKVESSLIFCQDQVVHGEENIFEYLQYLLPVEKVEMLVNMTVSLSTGGARYLLVKKVEMLVKIIIFLSTRGARYPLIKKAEMSVEKTIFLSTKSAWCFLVKKIE